MMGVGLFVTLCLWQIDRADEKQAMQALVENRLQQPAFEYAGGELDIEMMKHRKVEMQGHFSNEGQVLIDNVVLEGKPGYQVVTPFVFGNGQQVLVDRGWVPQGKTRDVLPDIDVDEAVVDIKGRVEKHRSKPVISVDKPSLDDGLRWFYIDTTYYKQTQGIEVPNFVIRLDAESPRGYERSDYAYDAKVGMHIGYAIQWGAFAVIAFVTWLGLSIKRQKQDQ